MLRYLAYLSVICNLATALTLFKCNNTFCNLPDLRFDLFKEHVENLVDDEVKPCENFYRHVCPVGVSEYDSIAYPIGYKLKDLSTKAWKKMQKDFPHFMRAVADVNIAHESDLIASQLHLAMALATHAQAPFTATIQGLSKKFDEYVKLIEAYNHSSVIEALMRNKPSWVNEWYPIGSVTNKRTRVILMDQGKVAMNNMVNDLAKIDKKIADEGLTPDIFGHYYTQMRRVMRKQSLEKSLPLDARLTIRDLFFRNTEFSTEKGVRITNALSEYIMYVSHITGGFSAAVTEALIGVQLARQILLDVPFTLSYELSECITKLLLRMCYMYPESRCIAQAPQEFASAFVSQYVSSMLAFHQVERILGDQLGVKSGYVSFRKTHAQLFFYALAASECVPFEKSQATGRATPISRLLRINSVVSVSAQFADAFSCQPKKNRFFKLYQSEIRQCIEKHLKPF